MAFINKTQAVTASLATVYTCPASKEAVIHAIYLTPLVASTTVTIKAGASGTTGYVLKDAPLVEGGTLYFPKPVNLAALEIIEVSGAAISESEIFLSILEKDA